ncbi:hypothetical protein I312_103232 [Cryptococcus bacillisporus CA1280]|uniref:uncharacterized protein n=1 Tax=Cryptococcus bacillisporus CA1280 TaxID=1296109 RepID=UPI003367ED68
MKYSEFRSPHPSAVCCLIAPPVDGPPAKPSSSSSSSVLGCLTSSQSQPFAALKSQERYTANLSTHRFYAALLSVSNFR